MKMYTLEFTQKLPLSLEECWDFFSTPKNLKMLTPEHLCFEMKGEQKDKKLYSGQIIAYTIRPIFSFPIEWITEITQVQEPFYFIDEQRFGPYKFWHHEHHFHPIPNGVEVLDKIYLKMPFGYLGEAFYWIKVKKDLESIFTYRKVKLEKLFGEYR